MKITPCIRPSFCGWFLVGPTASGKTAAAHVLALQTGADILSADSMLIYRGMDIGTAKPDRRMRREVRYWGIDIANPSETFSAGRYRQIALDAFRQADARGRRLIVVGGSGLYIKALTHGLAQTQPSDAAARARWEGVFEEEGIEGLQRALRARGEDVFNAVADPANPRRLIRALEQSCEDDVCLRKTWARADLIPAMPGLLPALATLRERIEQRVRQMYADGLLDEARALRTSGMLSQTAARAIGYAQANAVLGGELSTQEAISATVTATRRLAKRQMTWFKRQANVQWIEVDAQMNAAIAAAAIRKVWEANGPINVPLAQGE